MSNTDQPILTISHDATTASIIARVSVTKSYDYPYPHEIDDILWEGTYTSDDLLTRGEEAAAVVAEKIATRLEDTFPTTELFLRVASGELLCISYQTGSPRYAFGYSKPISYTGKKRVERSFIGREVGRLQCELIVGKCEMRAEPAQTGVLSRLTRWLS